MSLSIIARNMEITKATIEQLISGNVTPAVASNFHCTSASLQEFIDGGTSNKIASILGITANSLQELRSLIGKQGAVGLIIGLAISKNLEE